MNAKQSAALTLVTITLLAGLYPEQGDRFVDFSVTVVGGLRNATNISTETFSMLVTLLVLVVVILVLGAVITSLQSAIRGVSARRSRS